MATKKVKQQRALEKARQVLLEAEQARKKIRVTNHIREFTTGKIELLKHEEFTDSLGSHMYQMYKDGARQEVGELILILSGFVCDEDHYLREKTVDILSKFAGLVVGGNDLEIMVAVFNPLVNWLQNEVQYINGFGVACSQLHKIAYRLLENKKHWPDTEKLLVTLHQIQEGFLEKSSSMRGMAVKLLESLATKTILESLVNCYLTEKSDLKHNVETLLTNLGRRSVIYMVNRMMRSESKEERLNLIKLIPGAGNVVVPVLLECLSKKPPWYVIRNVVFIVSELNHSSLYSIVRPYLSHKDTRVQQQVLSCIVKISGNKCKSRLIDALPKVHDELKMQIIMQLGQMAGDDVVEALLGLLRARRTFREETYIELLERICVAFKFASTQDVIPALNELIEERQSSAGPSDPVIVAARDALLVLTPGYRHEEQMKPETDGIIDDEFNVYDADYKSGSIKKLEHSIKDLVAAGDLENAGNKLFANAVTAARDKDFASAELLRDKLLEINPLALSEVIKLGEIIEEEKSSSITNHHINLWSELYEKMTTEEFNALYYSMKQENYRVDQTIVRSGETDSSLYFVNSGTVRLTCQSGDRETFLKRLQPGEVIGVAQFFSASVWTVSMAAQTESQVHVLSWEVFRELEKEYPELERKLRDFCEIYDTVPDLLKMAGSDRREFARYGVSILINNMLLDPYGNAGKRSFRGELIDISRGGLCFSIRISSRENARLLLGRQIISEIKIAGGDVLKCFGVIVGIKFQHEESENFTVHVKFYRTMDQLDVTDVVNLEM